MILLYGHVLLSHPWSQVYLSIFLGLSSHSHPTFLLFFSYSIYLHVVFTRLSSSSDILSCISADYHWDNWGRFGKHIFHSSWFLFFHHVSILSFRSLTSCFRIYISFIVNVTLLLMIFVMFTSCFLNYSSNTFLISFAIFSSFKRNFRSCRHLERIWKLVTSC